MADTETSTASQRVAIINRKGLHARASARLSRLAGEFQSRIIVSHDGETADARSIMDLMMLVAHMGCEVELHAEGPDAAEAVTAIASLIADGFGEQGDADTVC
ncbi:MAG: HPr family phosphocarrier protein [Hyphomonas sp.]|nr:HPr family phosphocarrier protein [Hyphomonas sp.]